MVGAVLSDVHGSKRHDQMVGKAWMDFIPMVYCIECARRYEVADVRKCLCIGSNVQRFKFLTMGRVARSKVMDTTVCMSFNFF